MSRSLSAGSLLRNMQTRLAISEKTFFPRRHEAVRAVFIAAYCDVLFCSPTDPPCSRAGLVMRMMTLGARTELCYRDKPPSLTVAKAVAARDAAQLLEDYSGVRGEISVIS
jgi:hypothetical protein